MKKILYILIVVFSGLSIGAGNIPLNFGYTGIDEIHPHINTLHIQSFESQYEFFGEDLIDTEEVYSIKFIIKQLPSLQYCLIKHVFEEVYLLDVILFEADNSPPTVS